MKTTLFSILLAVATQLAFGQSGDKIKVACIGASITYGATIENREQNCYPAQLQQMLGNKYEVANYGVSGTTLIRKGDNPYWRTKQYQTALAANPNVVVIDLGGNDAKLFNRVHLDEYEQDYKDLIHSFTQLPSHPRVILLSAMMSFVRDTNGIWDRVITQKINPKIQNVAYAEHVELIDMHSPFVNKEPLFKDQLHPDKEGAGIMAQNVYRLIAQKRDANFDVFSKLDVQFTKSNYSGYECANFKFNGRDCKIVKPKMAAVGRPYIWRARFWGHEPQTEIALLQQGFHVVYCDVAEMLGNTEAIINWNKFYDLITKAGLGKKAVLEGMSRGGVYVFNWAAENPGKVSAVYVDNPLLSMQAWAGQYLGKPEPKEGMYLDFKKAWNLKTDDDVLNFKGSPVDKVKQIVKGKYPILILCADEDEAVDPAANTLAFEKKVKDLKGEITVMHKPGFKHHPHSFPNPAPIVDFILKGAGYDKF